MNRTPQRRPSAVDARYLSPAGIHGPLSNEPQACLHVSLASAARAAYHAACRGVDDYAALRHRLTREPASIQYDTILFTPKQPWLKDFGKAGIPDRHKGGFEGGRFIERMKGVFGRGEKTYLDEVKRHIWMKHRGISAVFWKNSS